MHLQKEPADRVLCKIQGIAEGIQKLGTTGAEGPGLSDLPSFW